MISLVLSATLCHLSPADSSVGDRRCSSIGQIRITDQLARDDRQRVIDILRYIRRQKRMAEESWIAAHPKEEEPELGVPCSGIIFAVTRAACDDLAQHLLQAGYRARAYHSGIPFEARLANQRSWMEGRTEIICGTRELIALLSADFDLQEEADTLFRDCLSRVWCRLGQSRRAIHNTPLHPERDRRSV